MLLMRVPRLAGGSPHSSPSVAIGAVAEGVQSRRGGAKSLRGGAIHAGGKGRARRPDDAKENVERASARSDRHGRSLTTEVDANELQAELEATRKEVVNHLVRALRFQPSLRHSSGAALPTGRGSVSGRPSSR